MPRTLLYLNPTCQDVPNWALDLEREGYDLLYAEESGQALHHLHGEHIDCILIDGPSENEELLAFVARLQEKDEDTPMVLLSSSQNAPKFSAEIGASALVVTPCECSELLYVLSSMSRGVEAPGPEHRIAFGTRPSQPRVG